MNTKLKIIMELERNPQGLHLRGVSRAVDSGLPNVKRFLEILEKENVVKREKEANLVKFSLKESQRTIAYLKQLHVENFLKLPAKIQDAVNEFLAELDDRPLMALIFGSYAKGTYAKNSDIDVLLVFQRLGNEKNIENTAKKIGMRTNTELSAVYLEYRNFEKNFLNKEHDFSKEIRRNAIVIIGVENYYNLLWRFLK